MNRTALGLLAALALLAGCSAGADHDADDLAFVQGMVPHHEQAVEMTALVPDRTDDPDVRALAEQIAAAQGPEIATMQGWLDDWESGGHEGMDHGDGAADHADHDGMLTEAQLTELATLEGDAFDTRFLTLMIEHHEGAVRSAETVLDDGEHEGVRDLARDVVRTQTAEITHMKELLR